MVDDVMFSSKYTEWETPPMLYDYLNKYFGTFTLDAAASDNNHLCDKYYTKEMNSLTASWQGESVFVNPPYGRNITGKWVDKAFSEVWKGRDEMYVTKVTMLLPSRTGTSWFYKYFANAEQVYFIEGRLHFFESGVECKSPAPFDSMVVVLNSNTIDRQPPVWGFIPKEAARVSKKRVKKSGVLSIPQADSDKVLVQ